MGQAFRRVFPVAMLWLALVLTIAWVVVILGQAGV